MPTHQNHINKNTAYFVTFTCYKWLHLIEQTQAYSAFYKWFEYLNNHHAPLLAYVIMPNHFHGIVFLREQSNNLNKLISNGKRFISYEIINTLKENKNDDFLNLLSLTVAPNEKEKGKLHNVFCPSFDAKECFNRKMLEMKLDYIHLNPIKDRWRLVNDHTDYPHSSAAFYEKGISNSYVNHYLDFY